MKKNYLPVILAVITVLFSLNSSAQNSYVNQVIVGSGGNFSNPDEHVMLSTYNPSDESTTFFGEVFTQSIQDIVISGEFAYIAAQDSIVKINIDNFSKVLAVEAIGVNQLLVHENVVFATFQYPATDNFVQVFSANNLEHITNIANIADESAGMVIVDDNLYVAVPGGWTSTTGAIAIINLDEYLLITQIQLGTEGIGVFDLFVSDGKIMSVNRTPYMGTTGYISTMSVMGSQVSSNIINEVIGKYAGVQNNILYTVMNNGIGAINLSDFSVIDNSIVDPINNTIAAVELDTVNQNFYVTSTDYFSMGDGTVYDMAGEAIGTFEANISPDALAIDYRDNTSVSENDLIISTVYPNPASHTINIDSELTSISKYKILDITGRIVKKNSINEISGNFSVNISDLNSGVYIIQLANENSVSSTRFIKN